MAEATFVKFEGNLLIKSRAKLAFMVGNWKQRFVSIDFCKPTFFTVFGSAGPDPVDAPYLKHFEQGKMKGEIEIAGVWDIKENNVFGKDRAMDLPPCSWLHRMAIQRQSQHSWRAGQPSKRLRLMGQPLCL